MGEKRIATGKKIYSCLRNTSLDHMFTPSFYSSTSSSQKPYHSTMSTIPRSIFRAGLKPKLRQPSKSAFHVVRRMSTQPQFSTNYDPAQGQKDVEKLLKGNGGKWRITESGKGLERPFKFKGFKKCWEFMNTVADECVKQKHHPEWSNVTLPTFHLNPI